MANNQGMFLQETPVIDTGYVNTLEQFKPDDLKQLFIAISKAIDKLNKTVNQKTSGLYPRAEFVTGNQFFPDPTLSSLTAQTPTYRQTTFKAFIIPPLLNAGTIVVAHGIDFNNRVSFVDIYGVANDIGVTKEALPLPFVDVAGVIAAGSIELSLDATNIYVTTTGNGTNLTKNYVVVEFLKQ
jgi:hypothetical protein